VENKKNEQPSELFKTIYDRRCYRRYKDAPVEQEKLDELIKAAVQAPSAGNLQPWDFVITKDGELKESIMKASRNQSFIIQAPVLITVCANWRASEKVYGPRGKELYCVQDTAAAMQNILLATHVLGLGACWIGEFDEAEIRKILRIPEFIKPVAILSVGYPEGETQKPARDDWRGVVHKETF